MSNYLKEFRPPQRILMGAGPSDVHPRVRQAMTAPIMGHLDPDFIRVMDDVMEMLRIMFKTSNPLTLPISGTGTAGMEAALCNVIEPGDTVVIATNGYFGNRMADIASRCGRGSACRGVSLGQGPSAPTCQPWNKSWGITGRSRPSASCMARHLPACSTLYQT